MSDVKRYHVTDAGLVEGQALGRISVVLGADHDRVTAERDALQALLTVADERADVLEGLLLQTNELLYAIQGDPGTVPSSAIDAMRGEVFTALKPAKGGGDAWKSWSVGNTVRYQGSGQDGEDCYCRMTKGSDYMIHEAPDDHESMVVLDDDGDELCVLVGEFRWIKP